MEGKRVALSYHIFFPVLYIDSLFWRALYASTAKVVEGCGDRWSYLADGLNPVGYFFLRPYIIQYLSVTLEMNEHGTIVTNWIFLI